MSRTALSLLCLSLCACAIDRTGEGAGPDGDAGPGDAAPRDAAGDAGFIDAGGDTGALDGGGDAGIVDGGGSDGGGSDGGADSGVDAGPADAGPADAGPPDAGPPDAGPPDAGPPDAGPPDAGPPDAGPDPGGALDFDGSDDRVSIRRDVDADFTIEAWIRTTTSRGGSQHYEGRGLIYADISGGANDFGTAILNDHFAFGVGNPDQTIESTTAVTTGSWFHVAAVRSRSTGRISVFVDGTQEATLLASNTGLLDARSSVIIGGNTIDARHFQGTIDEVRIWNVARTGAQISAGMNRRLTGSEPGLVGYYRFDDGSGTTAADSSLTGNDGTLGAGGVGIPTWVTSDAPIYP